MSGFSPGPRSAPGRLWDSQKCVDVLASYSKKPGIADDLARTLFKLEQAIKDKSPSRDKSVKSEQPPAAVWRVADRLSEADQLHYLAELAATHPRVTIQLLPLTASLHAAGGSGTFSILRFSHDPAPMLVLTDGPGGATVLDNQDSVATYGLALAKLHSLALTPDESARWLRRMAGAQRGRLPLR